MVRFIVKAKTLIVIPENIKNSRYLDSQQIELLDSVNTPTVDILFDDERLKNICQYYSLSPDEMDAELHKYAAELLSDGKVDEAWQVLLTTDVV